MISGMAWLYADKKKSMNTVLIIGAALVALITILYVANPTTANGQYFDPNTNQFGETPLTLLAGISVLVGLVIALVVRFAFAKNIDIGAAVTWAMLGNLIGLGFAAVSDIWINGYSPVVAIVGEFIPAAGPNLIFAAILVPILVASYAAMQKQSGR
jgi:uncharacterized integral membrane protein